MDKIKNKIELENLIIAILLKDFSLFPFFLQRIDIEDFSEQNQNIIKKLNDLKSEKELTNLEIITYLMSVRNFNSMLYLELTNTITSSQFKLEKLLMQFVDLAISIKYDSELKKALKENANNPNGLDMITDTLEKLKTLETGKIEKFKQVKSFSESLLETMTDIENELSNKNTYSFQFPSIPSMNNIFRPTNLIGISGAYKSGKTTTALNLISDLAKQNIPVGIFSLEVSERELKRKVLAMQTGVNFEALRNPQYLTESDKTKIFSFYKQQENIPLYINDQRVSIIEIESKARYWKDHFNIKCIMLDYLGLVMNKGKSTESREREIANYSACLKMLAKELDIVIICLAQLNRQGLQKPSSENLAESLGLVRDCDFFYTVFRPLQMGITKQKIKGNEIYFNDNHFIVKLDSARHMMSGKSILLELDISGNLKEISTEFNKPEESIKSIF